MTSIPTTEPVAMPEAFQNHESVADSAMVRPAAAQTERARLLAEIKRYESVPLATLMAAAFLDRHRGLGLSSDDVGAQQAG